MHQPHDAFEPPSNLEIPIWRYIDLAKFLSLLESQALYFARADQMDDKFEGSTSEPSIAEFREMLRPYVSTEAFASQRGQESEMFQNIRRYVYMSCWHMNEHESYAMWSIYQNRQAMGLAIRSTYQRLSESLTDEIPVFIGQVKYIDYAADRIAPGNFFYRFLHKRKSFDFERELRAICNTSFVGKTPEGQEDAVVAQP